MIKIGITGSLASGKTTASKILSKGRGPLFSADRIVRDLYQIEKFKLLIRKKLQINNHNRLKEVLKKFIFKSSKNINKLEKIIHPFVRKKMKAFSIKNKKKSALFYEIPLLIESNLMDFFSVIIFIKANRKIRLRRFKLKGGEEKLFNLLNNNQISDNRKIKFCDYVVTNEKNLKTLKKNLINIISKYA